MDLSFLYYSVPLVFVVRLFFRWIKGCDDFQVTTSVHKKEKTLETLRMCVI